MVILPVVVEEENTVVQLNLVVLVAEEEEMELQVQQIVAVVGVVSKDLLLDLVVPALSLFVT
jgi:hypothetical protein